MLAERLKGTLIEAPVPKPQMSLVPPLYRCSCDNPQCEFNEFANQFHTNVTHWQNTPKDIDSVV